MRSSRRRTNGDEERKKGLPQRQRRSGISQHLAGLGVPEGQNNYGAGGEMLLRTHTGGRGLRFAGGRGEHIPTVEECKDCRTSSHDEQHSNSAVITESPATAASAVTQTASTSRGQSINHTGKASYFRYTRADGGRVIGTGVSVVTNPGCSLEPGSAHVAMRGRTRTPRSPHAATWVTPHLLARSYQQRPSRALQPSVTAAGLRLHRRGVDA